jgi:putative ABC transport system permease protein
MVTKDVMKQFVQQGSMMLSGNSLEDNLSKLGVSDPDRPAAILIYPLNFEAKEKISAMIEAYNQAAGEDKAIHYTDYVGLIMSSVTTIVNAISYVLVAFVSISLVVSSIMIGIITYISVLERTKEIGILRSIGASRRDVSRVFNAETLIVGFAAGVIGILATLGLTLIANLILGHLTGIPDIAALPPLAGLILVGISMALTLIAGLIPSGIASRKDPVVALRTE